MPEKARKPKLDYPRLRIARFSGPALTEGIDAYLDACLEPAYGRIVIQEAPAVLGNARYREIEEAYHFVTMSRAQRLLGGATTEEDRIAVLDLAIELPDEVEPRPPEVDGPHSSAHADDLRLKNRRRQSRLPHVHPAHRLPRPIGRAISEIDDGTGLGGPLPKRHPVEFLHEVVAGHRRRRK